MKMGILLLALSAAQPGVLVDRIVAVVDRQVITHSELLTEARVALALRQSGKAASADLNHDFLGGFREYLINAILVSQQARRLASVEISDAELQQKARQFESAFRSQRAYRAFLRRFDISEEVVANILRRTLRNQRFVAERMRLRVLQSGKGAQMGDERYQKALKGWLDELRANADIRLPGPAGRLERQATP